MSRDRILIRVLASYEIANIFFPNNGKTWYEIVLYAEIYFNHDVVVTAVYSWQAGKAKEDRHLIAHLLFVNVFRFQIF